MSTESTGPFLFFGICTICSQELDANCFRKDKRFISGRCNTCKKCHSKTVLKWKQKNYIKEKERQRKGDLRRKFNLSLEEYNNMLVSQGDCCIICNKHQSEFKKSLAVDHCHKTGKIRGLLCNNCNLLLGYANDNIETLKNAIHYLTNN